MDLITVNCVNKSGAIEFIRLTDLNVTSVAIGDVYIVIVVVSFIVSVNVFSSFDTCLLRVNIIIHSKNGMRS